MADQQSPLVCVTGANGFIAGHLVAQLLARGYRVRGTVRSVASPECEYLRALPGADRLELVEADLLNAQGTLNVYRACKNEPSIKRVVTTSSFATIIFGHNHAIDNTPYTEEEWNTVSAVEGGGPADFYRVSKVRAERVGWEFMTQEQPGFDLITLCPPFVLGPFLPGYKRENESSMMIRAYIKGERSAPAGGLGIVDVRDLADAHIRAFEKPGARGRYLLTGGGTSKDAAGADIANASLTFHELALMLKELFPQYPVRTDEPQQQVLAPRFNVSKIVRDLGWSSQPLKVTLQEQVVALQESNLL